MSFLVHWNYKQYHKELNVLQKNVDTQFKLAEGEIRDSVLYSFIEVLSDTKVDYFKSFDKSHFDNFSLDLFQDTVIGIFEYKENGFSTFSNDSIVNSDIISSHIKGFQIMEALRDSSNSVALKFKERLKEQGIENDLQIQIVGTEIHDDDSLNLKIVNQQFEIGSKKDIVISKYSRFLFSKILPSIMMSLLLFTLVAFGFYYLNKLRKEQESINILKNDFVSNMTHELKTPISTISVAIEALSSYGQIQDPIKTAEYLDVTKNELSRLNILIDKVLKISSFEKTGMNLDLQVVDIRILLESILKSMKLHFEKHTVITKLDVNGYDHFVNGDKVHLTNLFYNLLDNAIKYSRKNPNINIQISEGEEYVIIEIVDQGIGIPKQYQDKVFDRFFRVPQGDIHNTKGYGLGLNYVKEVVNKHQGKVEMESELNLGTTIRVRLKKNQSDV